MKGRKPKPATLLLDRHDADKRKAATPTPPTGSPQKPDWLNADGSAAWDDMIKHLDAMGILAQSDIIALGALAQNWAIYIGAMRELNRGDMVITQNGQRIPSPFLSVADKAEKRLHKLLTEFGLTPVSRARIAIGRQDGPTKPGSGILNFIGAK